MNEMTLTMNGELSIDLLNGVATFTDGWGQTILRVTHLPTPVPERAMIDLVAIKNVTSYTPLSAQEEPPPLGPRMIPLCPSPARTSTAIPSRR